VLAAYAGELLKRLPKTAAGATSAAVATAGAAASERGCGCRAIEL
jgi:hypothetical protein